MYNSQRQANKWYIIQTQLISKTHRATHRYSTSHNIHKTMTK